MKIAGTTVLLTGASGGIGAAIARQLAAGDASLVLLGRDAAKLEVLADQLGLQGASASVLVGDLAEPGVPERLIRTAVRDGAVIDIIINCAGVQSFGLSCDETADDTANLFNINVFAPISLINAALPHLMKNGRGQIVNVGSIFGSIGFPFFASYSASKFALRGYSEALRRELAGTGISVTYVAPRFTRTAFNRSAVSRMANALKMGQDEPQDVAARVIAAIEHDDRSRYLGWPEKVFVRVNSILPRLVDWALAKQVTRMRTFATGLNQSSLLEGPLK